jgi:hypothetical protein
VTSYRFVPGIDYGLRKGTLGWNIHMAEGGDGTVTWLRRRTGETVAAWHKRVNGVSATFVVLQTGEAVQMVPWDHAAGNLNPNDRSSDDKGFYGRRFLLEVLGTHWTDPNAWTLSAELCGWRADGPNRDQVETLVKLIAESRERYPQQVGAFGHADQTDTKGCPGTAPLMREFWTRVGHGEFAGQEDDVLIDFTLPKTEIAGEVTVKEGGASVVTIDGGDRPTLPAGLVRPALGGEPGSDDQLTLAIRGDLPHYQVYVGNEIGFVLASDVEFEPYAATGEDAVLAAKREGYDLARAGFGITHPAPTVTWPPRP